MKRQKSGHAENTDAHTLLLLHLDTDIKDYSMYRRTFTNTGMTNESGGPFGTGCACTNAKRLYGGDLTGLFEQIFSSDNFTVDFWVKLDTKIEAQFFGFGNNNTWDYHETGEVYNYNNLGFIYQMPQGVGGAAVGTYPELGKWIHVAYILNNRKLNIYAGGIKKASGTDAKSVISHGSLPAAIGNKSVSAQNYGSFYLSEFRVSDVARWTDNFTPPTQPY